jgi:hypothetical protein
MKYLASLVASLMLLTVVGVAPVSAGKVTEFPNNVTIKRDVGSESRVPSYWENEFPGFDCKKHKTNERLLFPAIAGLKVKTIYKGSGWHNIYHGNVYATEVYGYKWVGPKGERIKTKWAFGFSHKFSCVKREEPKGPEGDAYVKKYGPKGDPWYRFTFFNPRTDGAANATCKAVFEGRNGKRVVRRKLVDGQGWKSPWMWVRGSTQVRMVCFEGGERAFGPRTFRSAPPGYYGPLYREYQIGYFPL